MLQVVSMKFEAFWNLKNKIKNTKNLHWTLGCPGWSRKGPIGPKFFMIVFWTHFCHLHEFEKDLTTGTRSEKWFYILGEKTKNWYFSIEKDRKFKIFNLIIQIHIVLNLCIDFHTYHCKFRYVLDIEIKYSKNTYIRKKSMSEMGN